MGWPKDKPGWSKDKQLTEKSNWSNIAKRNLSMDDAREIRKLKKEGKTYKEIMEQFPITITCLKKIISYQHYKENNEHI